jgi:hypothetical protein
VKVVLLVCCNSLVWGKQGFHNAFPNALVLGWIGKNPANSTPFIRQFMTNVFRGVSDSGDPLLMNHDHIAQAWTDTHYKQHLFSSDMIGYLLPNGDVYGVDTKATAARKLGTADEIITVNMGAPNRNYVFGYYADKGQPVLEP